MPINFEDWHRGQMLSLLSQSLQRQRCLQGNKSMHTSFTLQTLQVIKSFKSLFSLLTRRWKSMAPPLQQDAVSSTSLSPHPSLLSLLCATTCCRLYFRVLIMFSLHLARCCHAPASMFNCFILSSSSMFLLLMSSISASFSRSLWRILSSTHERVWSWLSWTFFKIACLSRSPY